MVEKFEALASADITGLFGGMVGSAVAPSKSQTGGSAGTTGYTKGVVGSALGSVFDGVIGFELEVLAAELVGAIEI